MAKPEVGGPHPTSRPADPPITVHMDGELVIVRLTGPFDRDATHALAEVITVAVAEGSVAVIDLTDEATAETPTMPTPTRDPHRHIAPTAAAIDAGLLRLATAPTPWVVDLAARTLCRSATVTDRRCTPPHAWCSVDSITISTQAVIAITAEGDRLVTTPAVHPAGPRC